MGEKDRRTGTSTGDDAVGPVLKYGFPVSTGETGHVKHTKPPTIQPPTSRANEQQKFADVVMTIQVAILGVTEEYMVTSNNHG